MPTPRVIVEISASRVEVATLRGRSIAEWRCERMGRPEWPSPYTMALPECAATVGRLLADMGITRATATIVYAAPGSVSGLTSCAGSINAAGAEQASLLALANVADFPIENSPSDMCTLFLDKARKPAGDASSAPAPPQRHILACAEAEQRAAAICGAMAGAGLTVERLLPADAVATADAVRMATAPRANEEVLAVVWIGEHSVNLAVGAPGRLLFARTTSVGIESLVESLCRPLRPREAEGRPVTLSHEAARALLLNVGVPEAEGDISAYPTLTGSSLLPHLQPIVQRLSIEIKQSLRFGVAEIERAGVRVRLAGPGAAVPGLGEAIAQGSGFALDADSDERTPPDAQDSSTGGLLSALTRCPGLTIALLPAEARRAFWVGRVRRALVTGTALALAYVGCVALDAHRTLAAERSTLNAINAAFQSTEGPMAVRQLVMADRGALAAAEGRLRRALDQTPDWPTIMETLAEITPPEVRLQVLDMVRESGRGTIHLRGHIRFEEERDPAALIHRYVAALEAVPLVESVRLGATQRAALAGHDSQTFDLFIVAIAMPPAQTNWVPTGASAGEGK